MSVDTAVDTKKAERRSLSYADLGALSADLDAIEASHNAGTLKTTGNWSAGQIMKHSATLMLCAIDGFPGKPAPWLIRKIAKAMFLKKGLAGGSPNPGFKIPKQADFLDPGNASFEEGLGALRSVCQRVGAGEKLTHPSPVFETLTHDQWVRLGLGHAALHMSFIEPGGAS